MLCECKEMILKTFIKPHPSSDKNLARRKKNIVHHIVSKEMRTAINTVPGKNTLPFNKSKDLELILLIDVASDAAFSKSTPANGNVDGAAACQRLNLASFAFVTPLFTAMTQIQ